MGIFPVLKFFFLIVQILVSKVKICANFGFSDQIFQLLSKKNGQNCGSEVKMRQ